MPRIEDIEQFNETLVQAGDEPEILAERGEELEHVERPDEGLPGDLGDLLSEEEDLGGESAEAGEEEGEELLSRLSEALEDEEEETTPEPAEEEGEEEDIFAGLDLGEEEFETPSDFEEAAEEEPGGEEEAAEEEAAEEEPTSDLDEFTGGELGDLGDLGDLDEEDFDLDADLADIAGGLEEAAPEEGEAEEPEAETPETGEPAAEAPEAEAAEEPSEPTDELDLASIEEDFVDEEGEEEFDLPEESLEEIAAGAEEVPDEEEPETEAIPDEELAEFAAEGEDEEGFDEFGDMEGFGDLEAADEGEFDVDEFNLDEFGTEFGVVEEAVEGLEGGEEEGAAEEGAEGEVEAAPEETPELTLEDDEFDHLRKTLGVLPLNLKREVERIIAEGKGNAEQTEELVRALVAGSSPAQVAEIASRILGRRIQIPKGYQKRSGLAFEAEQRTFAYRFKHKILPVIKAATAAALALGVVGWLSYQFIYRPLYARSLYTEGYEDVQADRYTEGNETFDRAYEVWPREPWFFRYAELFVDKRRYQLAVEKYDQLVFGMEPERRAFLMEQVRQRNLGGLYRIGNRRRTVYEMINVDKEGILDHAALQSEELANYERANSLLSILLFDNATEYDALLARGDNYMRWARSLEDEEARGERYEDARLAYARLINRYGSTDELLFRMLRYFIRTDNKTEVDRLTATFQADPDTEINPEIYAELAGYLIDKGDNAVARDIIFRALEENQRLPELHYQLARFYRTLSTPGEELTALENAHRLFEGEEPLSGERIGMFIDTDIRLGEYYYDQEEFITAEQHLMQAQNRYEQAIEQRLIRSDSSYGRLYAKRGDIYYFAERDLDAALDYYQRAEANEYQTRALDYRIGNIYYRSGRYDPSVERFLDASGRVTRDATLLWATGNALYNRENYPAAQAHYEELIDQLMAERSRIQNLLVEENPRHRALIERMIQANNNLGIALYQLYQRDRTNQELLSEGLTYLTRAQELAGNYSRDPQSGERSLATNLAYINTREILYPENEGTVQIYREIPDTMDAPF